LGTGNPAALGTNEVSGKSKASGGNTGEIIGGLSVGYLPGGGIGGCPEIHKVATLGFVQTERWLGGQRGTGSTGKTGGLLALDTRGIDDQEND